MYPPHTWYRMRKEVSIAQFPCHRMSLLHYFNGISPMPITEDTGLEEVY